MLIKIIAMKQKMFYQKGKVTKNNGTRKEKEKTWTF